MSGARTSPAFVPAPVLDAVLDAGLALGVFAVTPGSDGPARWEWHPGAGRTRGALYEPDLYLWVGASAPFGFRAVARCVAGFRAAFFAALGELRRQTPGDRAEALTRQAEALWPEDAPPGDRAEAPTREADASGTEDAPCDGCWASGAYTCGCGRCSREAPDERFHSCAKAACLAKVEASHLRVRGRPAEWPSVNPTKR